MFMKKTNGYADREKGIETVEMTIKNPTGLTYGQRVYVIDAVDSKFFSEKCPICGGTHKVEIKGEEFYCPACQSGYHLKNNLRIWCYEVHEYIVNSVTLKGEERKIHYGKEASVSTSAPEATFGAFRRGREGVNTITLFNWMFEYRDPHDRSVNENLGHRICFTDRKDAEEFKDELHAMQKQCLMDFNKEHGTDYKYPFKI